MKPLWIVGLLALGGCAQAMDAQMKLVDNLRIKDAVAAYEKAREAGDPLDECVKAKLVAIAYEDARDPTNASAWRAREQTDCKVAVAALRGGQPLAIPAARPGF